MVRIMPQTDSAPSFHVFVVELTTKGSLYVSFELNLRNLLYVIKKICTISVKGQSLYRPSSKSVAFIKKPDSITLAILSGSVDLS